MFTRDDAGTSEINPDGLPVHSAVDLSLTSLRLLSKLGPTSDRANEEDEAGF